MPATTATAIITGAFDTLGIYAPGASIAPANATDALRRLNLLMGQLKLQSLTQPVRARDVFPLVAGKGSPTNPYTIGPGGDFAVTRPIRLAGAGLLLVQSAPASTIELQRDVITDDAYQAIAIKDLASTLFTWVYYNPTYAHDRGSVFLYPVPNIATNSLVLYRDEPLTAFATLTTSYDLPDGLAEAIEYALARRLLTPYGITDQAIVGDVIAMANTTMANFKRANLKLSDLPTDPAWTHSPRGRYDITTGSGGGR